MQRVPRGNARGAGSFSQESSFREESGGFTIGLDGW